MTRHSSNRRRVLPGFKVTLTFTIAGLVLVVLVPLATIPARAISAGPHALLLAMTDSRVISSFRVTLTTAFAAACVNAVAGPLVAWVLVRYRFPGRRVFDALIDLPFALPTAVAGITLAGLYGPNGWLGRPLAALGITVAFTPLGIVVALIFIGLPLVVRTLQPVIEDLDVEIEEAATSLGAPRTAVVRRVILPCLYPAWLTGFSLAFARAIGEYGSVVFIAGNIPMVSEIAPLMIVTKLQQYDYAGATVVAFVLMAMSFVLLLTINALQGWSARRLAG